MATNLELDDKLMRNGAQSWAVIRPSVRPSPARYRSMSSGSSSRQSSLNSARSITTQVHYKKQRKLRESTDRTSVWCSALRRRHRIGKRSLVKDSCA